MKTLSLLTALLLVASLPTSAHAACSTAALAGTWRVVTTDPADGESAFCVLKVSTVGDISGTCTDKTKPSGRLTSNSACRITGTILGRAFVGRTEALPTNSPLKPNLIHGWAASPVGAVAGFRQ